MFLAFQLPRVLPLSVPLSGTSAAGHLLSSDCDADRDHQLSSDYDADLVLLVQGVQGRTRRQRQATRR